MTDSSKSNERKVKLDVRISNPQHTIWMGEAKSISSQNSQGDFDILPKHANFITIIKKKPIVVRTMDGKVTKYDFDIAIIYAHDDDIRIYSNV